jgi:hypothetical protein
VLKGYDIPVKTNISENQAKALYDIDTLRRRLEMDFSMNTIKPAFIGELCLESLNVSNQYVKNCMKAYTEYSLITQCPIFINCISSCNSQCVFDNLQS